MSENARSDKLSKAMKYVIFIHLFFHCLCFVGYGQVQLGDTFSIILRRVHAEQLNDVRDIKSLDRRVHDDLATLNLKNGKWEEYDYSDHKRIGASWLPVLEKIRNMTVAYTHPSSAYFQDTVLWRAINKSLYYFTSHKPLPYCDNWYQQGITRPQSLTLSLINMKFGTLALDSLIEEGVQTAICIDTAVHSNGRNNPMHKYNFGSNKALIAMGWIYMGALLRDQAVLEIGVRETYAPIAYTSGEGIQHDLSYDMHYGYLYNGGYGTEFMSTVAKSAGYTIGTPYALEGERLSLFRKFIMESIFGVIRGQWMDWNVLGRGISRIGATQRNYTDVLLRLASIDPAAKEQYDSIRRRMNGEMPVETAIQPQHRHYWSTDYTVHKRPTYFFSIHAVSSRNYSQEIGNQENLKGFWGSQGTTNLQIRGDEYENIFPLWNWAKLPGTTLPDTIPIMENKAPGEGDRRGTHAFAGGVSDSLYGVTAYVVDNDLKTSAKKSWFMFDSEIVCLGAGIHSTLSRSVNTTINQAILSVDGFSFGTADGSMTGKKTFHKTFKDGLKWVLHDRVGYVFPFKADVALIAENRKDDWQSVRKTGAKTDKKVENKSIFQLSIAHGTKPTGGKYAYVLLPGIEKSSEIGEYMAREDVKIQYNTEQLQAVYHRGLQLWQMVFYQANIPYIDDDIRVWTDIPAVIMLKKKSMDSYQLHISDPSQLHDKITVKIKIKGETEIRSFVFDLPEEPYAGQTKSVFFTT